MIFDNVLCAKHKQEVFNLEVEDAHTYFVALPNSGKAVWVHNNSIDAPYYQPAPQAPSPAPTGSAPFIVNRGGSERGSGTFNVGLGALAGRMQSGPAPSLAPPFSQESLPLSSPGRWSENPLFDNRLSEGPLSDGQLPPDPTPTSLPATGEPASDFYPLEKTGGEGSFGQWLSGSVLDFLGVVGPPVAAGAVLFHASAAGGEGDMVTPENDPSVFEQDRRHSTETPGEDAAISADDEQVASVLGVTTDAAIPYVLAGMPYDVGLAKDLRKNPPLGQVTQVNHVPQSRQAESLVGDFNPANAIGNEPAIRLPTSEHEAVNAAQSARTAPASARDLLASDIRIMRQLTEAPNSALRQLINLVQETHPWDFLDLLL